MTGRLDLIIGPMFAGKTGEFIRLYRRYKSIGKEILVINHSSDERYGKGVVSSHNKDQIKCVSISDFSYICSDDKYIKSDIVMIDEGQFFTGLVEFVVNGIDLDNKHFIVSGLSGDCFRKPFGEILNLIPYCTNIKHMKSLCNVCMEDGLETEAIYSMRKTTDITQQVVGSGDIYLPVCHKHYDISYFDVPDVCKTISTDNNKEIKKNVKNTKIEKKDSDTINWMFWGC
tara:strand:- start:70 stop:756 length:687 start_codon:yes stop_codon:yes gene_type:complete